MEDIQVGQLISSKSGRDKDRFFLVFEVLNNGFVRIIDGDLRKVENPKKKNIKHIRLYQQVAHEIAAKIANGENLTNADVRKALENLRSFSKE